MTHREYVVHMSSYGSSEKEQWARREVVYKIRYDLFEVRMWVIDDKTYEYEQKNIHLHRNESSE
jgi:hypothetical protein